MAIKKCKLILGVFPEHGETLAMKGLSTYFLDKKEEAHDLVKRGLKFDLTSHICWHVYGLIYRADKNYDQAIRCYRNALKYDKDNSQILRDLSLLQAQMRDFDGYEETRLQILLLKPSMQANWVAYAVSQHINGKPEKAFKVLKSYTTIQEREVQERATAQKKKAIKDKEAAAETDNNTANYENSELMLYTVTVLQAAGQIQEALDFLISKEDKIVDVRESRETKAGLLFQLGMLDEAEAIYYGMLKENPEDKAYYDGLERVKDMQSKSMEERLSFWASLKTKFPRAHAPTRLPLFFATGAPFLALMDSYLRANIRKGVSPIFRNVRKVYADAVKGQMVGDIVKGYVQSLLTCSKFADTPETPLENPSVIVWCYYFLGQHYDLLGGYVAGLDMINKAIAHTPTVLELYMVKAKICKHAGNYIDAAFWLNFARELDTADRYINSKCVKYMYRAGHISRAQAVAALFARDAVDTEEYFSDMQHCSYETEAARAFINAGYPGKALKKLHAVEKHFTVMTDDQFDFHSYCVRKMTLRSYIKLITFTDHLRDSEFYVDASLLAIQIYLDLYETPFRTKAEIDEANHLATLTPSERKKLLSKQRKQEMKEEATKSVVLAEPAVVKDKDPEGLELVKVKAPLDEALKFLKPLQLYAPANISVPLIAFEVFCRRGKLLLMLQSLKRVYLLEPTNASLHRNFVRFLAFLKSAPPENVLIKTFVANELRRMIGEHTDPHSFNDLLLPKTKDSLKHALAYAEASLSISPAVKHTLAPLILAAPQSGLTIELCKKVGAFLRDKCDDATAAEIFKGKCAIIFPLATDFSTQPLPAGLIECILPVVPAVAIA